jgi:hypothetical protein
VKFGGYNNQGFKRQPIITLFHHLSNLLSENVQTCILNSNESPEQIIQGRMHLLVLIHQLACAHISIRAIMLTGFS